MTPKKNRPWTAEEDRRLIELPSFFIAVTLKRTIKAISSRLSVLRKRFREPPSYQDVKQ
jgi:hypothetical protein